MRFEHEQHGEALEKLAAPAHDFVPPPGACNSWQALCRGLAQLREDLMQHIHLENNNLFEGLANTNASAPAPVGQYRPAPAVTAAVAPARPAGGRGCGGAGNGRGGCV